jgi:hypothetical protein
VEWIYLAQNRDQLWALVNMVINVQVPKKAEYFLTSRVTISFSRRNVFHGASFDTPHSRIFSFSDYLQMHVIIVCFIHRRGS